MRKRILFVENFPDFLDVRAKLLEIAGYQVLKAYTLEQARAKLDEQNVNLALIDVRMVDDNDVKDISGVLFAQEEKYHKLPKIILTNHDTMTDPVRKALTVAADGIPPAVGFVFKREGDKALLDAVERAFDLHVRVNWNLNITQDERNPICFAQLVSDIMPDVPPDLLAERAEELECLFRSLFLSEEAIRIERKLWQRDGRVAVTVVPFAKNREPDSQLVICGLRSRIVEEAKLYSEFAPRAQASTALKSTHETVHFAANSYALADTDLDRVVSLGERWRTSPDALFKASLKTLFGMTLVEWSKERRIPEESRTLDQVYRERLGLTRELGAGAEQVRERVKEIVRWIPVPGESMELEGSKLTFRFGGEAFTYPDPTLYLDRTTRHGQRVLLTYAPGTLTGDNVLTDINEHTWLTDFAEAGLAPVLWNFVSFEAAIRFDWAESSKLQWLHGLEKCLLSGKFSKLDLRDMDGALRKPARAIMALRRLAASTVGKDALPYHLGILFHALRRVADMNPSLPYKQSQRLRYSHCLLSAAMISRYLKEIVKHSSESGIRIDKDDRAVYVDGERVAVRGRLYALLLGFYENANRLCTRRQIIEEFLGEKYETSDTAQVNRLNTLILRLRNLIEEDPSHPRVIVREHGEGYRFVTARAE